MDDDEATGRKGKVSKQARRSPARAIRWTAAMRDAFFTHLAGSCNITAAARAIAVPPSQIYYHRKINPTFGDEWHETIAIAYQILETRMIGYVLAGGGDMIPAVDGLAPEPIAWDAAVKLLTLHKARRDGTARHRGPSQAVATRAETDAAIIGKLKALAARKQRAADANTQRTSRAMAAADTIDRGERPEGGGA